MTKKELQKAGVTWRQIHLGTTASKRNTIGSPSAPEYDFGGKKCKICPIREAMIPPLVTTVVTGMADLTTHSKYLSVVV